MLAAVRYSCSQVRQKDDLSVCSNGFRDVCELGERSQRLNLLLLAALAYLGTHLVRLLPADERLLFRRLHLPDDDR